jgi:hypothetical protein
MTWKKCSTAKRRRERRPLSEKKPFIINPINSFHFFIFTAVEKFSAELFVDYFIEM